MTDKNTNDTDKDTNKKLILLVNDDGIYSPSLAAMKDELDKWADVYVVAPATEQSGVGHCITFLTPLVPKKVYIDRQFFGWAVDGTPSDCVKVGILEICPRRPDLVVSGINPGMNVGNNVVYSGTVAAASEASLFGIPSVAVSVETSSNPRFAKTAVIALDIIKSILKNSLFSSSKNERNSDDSPYGPIFNLNIPQKALDEERGIRIVPVDRSSFWDEYAIGEDPMGRKSYWLKGNPRFIDPNPNTDLRAFTQGYITLTPLSFELTQQSKMNEMQSWVF